MIVLQSGESDGDARLPYLQKGIVAILAQATNGIGVILEHRYYGGSFPTPDLSVGNLRFLTTDQAMADMAYFAQNIKFPGMEDMDLTSSKNAYIAYGGSYAGAFVAFVRKLYPEVYWGAISSSGVSEAIYDYWRYYEPVAQYGPPACMDATKKIVNVVDNILLKVNDSSTTAQLKSLWGMPNITYDDDFADMLLDGVEYWQSLNWDPAVSSPVFYQYCDNITDPTNLYNNSDLASHASSFIALGGWANESTTLTTAMLNFIGWIGENFIAPCAASNDTQDFCFGTHGDTYYGQGNYTSATLADNVWRSWPWQYCTQWGFLQTGSGVPADQLPLISRLLTLEYEGLICEKAFNITTPPDTAAINKYGGWSIAYDRLAFINGQWDPWRPSTPASAQAPGGGVRPSTAEQPFIIISEAVHHWDENGLFANETTAQLPPPVIADTQKEEVQFVQEWMEEWKLHCLISGAC